MQPTIQKTAILLLTKLFDRQVQQILLAILHHLQKYQYLTYYLTSIQNYQKVYQHFPLLPIKIFHKTTDQNLIQYIVTIGGDGSILYAASLFQNRSTPKIIAFQKGTLGFLCKFKVSDLKQISQNIIKDIKKEPIPYKIESKMRIKCQKKNSSNLFKYNCLNQITITKQKSQTLLKLQIYINNKFFTVTSGDGIIISTPTGSTAYSLSAGGPIIQNQVKTIMIVAISPNSLSFRPLCLPSHVKLGIRVNKKSRVSGFISCDGQISDSLRNEEYIQISESQNDVELWSEQRDEMQLWFVKLKQLLNWNNQYIFDENIRSRL